jgi:hypothetical protein
MEKLGVDTVRAKLRYGHAPRDLGAEVVGIVVEPPHPKRSFVEAWLAEKDAADRKHRTRINLWTLIFAAIGAATGIAGIVVGLLHR